MSPGTWKSGHLAGVRQQWVNQGVLSTRSFSRPLVKVRVRKLPSIWWRTTQPVMELMAMPAKPSSLAYGRRGQPRSPYAQRPLGTRDQRPASRTTDSPPGCHERAKPPGCLTRGRSSPGHRPSLRTRPFHRPRRALQHRPSYHRVLSITRWDGPLNTSSAHLTSHRGGQIAALCCPCLSAPTSRTLWRRPLGAGGLRRLATIGSRAPWAARLRDWTTANHGPCIVSHRQSLRHTWLQKGALLGNLGFEA